jgi:hypothetical protein
VRKFVDDAADDHTGDGDGNDDDKAPAVGSVAVTDDCEVCALLGPDGARGLRRALAGALRVIGERPD